MLEFVANAIALLCESNVCVILRGPREERDLGLLT